MAKRDDEDTKVVSTWRKIAPYFHVIGFIITVTFIATMKYAQLDAYAAQLAKQDKRLDTLEERSIRIDTTLNDLRDYFHLPKHGAIGVRDVEKYK